MGMLSILAGDQMYMDYAGDKLEIVDAMTGEVRPGRGFCAILPCSHYTYSSCVVTETGGSDSRLARMRFTTIGGVPMAIVPDKPESAVTPQ